MNRQRHVAIIAYGGTGSTALFDELLNNKHVYQHDNKEILDTQKSKCAFMNKHIDEGKHWYYDHICQYLDAADAENKKLVIHIKPTNMNKLKWPMEDIFELLSERFDFVYIKRKNILSTVFSVAAKYHRKVEFRNLNSDYNYIPSKTLNLSVDEYYSSMKAITAKYKLFDRLLSEHKSINICYETQLDVDMRKVADLITTELGFYDDYTYTPMYVNYNSTKNKWSDIPLSVKIENYNEWVELLTGTEYEWMLKG